RQGLGVGIIDTAIGDREADVARAAPGVPDIPFPIWLTAHRDILTNRRMRRVFDFLMEELSLERKGAR
ncbi:MAG: LysR family transcriptional regulator, partial [Pseudomonadota bacterium]